MKISILLAALLLASPLAAQEPHIARNAPRDCPRGLTTAQQAELDSILAPLFAQARREWPTVAQRYRDGLGPERSLFVTTRLHDPSGPGETVFIAVDSLGPGTITGRIWNQLISVRTYRFRQRITFADSLLLDWTITQPDGTEEGNAVGKFVDRCATSGT